MADITGVVQDIVTRDVSGGKKSYDIVVAGQKYGAGLYAPKCKVGDYVKFELDDSRGYKNVGRNSLKVSANKPPAEAMAEAETTAPQKNSAGASVDSRQDIISRQAATNSAIAFMAVLAATESLGLPAASGKAAKRSEVMEGILHQYEKEFYERNTGIAWKDISPAPKEAEAVNEQVVEDAPAPVEEDEWK